jgi:hypothetical protein
LPRPDWSAFADIGFSYKVICATGPRLIRPPDDHIVKIADNAFVSFQNFCAALSVARVEIPNQ